MRLSRRTGLQVVVALLAAGAVFASPRMQREADELFPHEKHSRVFPLCSTCHAGVVEAGQPLWPDPVRCASCHDGVIKPRVKWEPRAGPRGGNLRFTHERHNVAATSKRPADSTASIRNCSACHNQAGTPRMAVRHAVVGQCIDCHGLKDPHIEVPSEACSTCHVRLTDAPGLTRARISAFPKPRSHDAPGFLLGGHGKLARPATGSSRESGISASCATCHARNLCVSCHVNANESRAIMALALDTRSPGYALSQPVPASHRVAGFIQSHGKEAQRSIRTCSTCHTRESCATCHVGGALRVIAALPAAGPGRAAGAQLTRMPPSTHTRDFRENHGSQAAARPRTCETCHERSACLQCHRPDVARRAGYHPPNFLTRHPSSAYSREASCSDCHNPAQFCQSCHQQAGLVAAGRIGSAGYHDVFRGFTLGHGQAARQSLESCASCHAERDCAACHSAVGGGFRFSPHGPGFDPARARSKNPSVCIACHGRVIPGVQ